MRSFEELFEGGGARLSGDLTQGSPIRSHLAPVLRSPTCWFSGVAVFNVSQQSGAKTETGAQTTGRERWPGDT